MGGGGEVLCSAPDACFTCDAEHLLYACQVERYRWCGVVCVCGGGAMEVGRTRLCTICLLQLLCKQGTSFGFASCTSCHTLRAGCMWVQYLRGPMWPWCSSALAESVRRSVQCGRCLKWDAMLHMGCRYSTLAAASGDKQQAAAAGGILGQATAKKVVAEWKCLIGEAAVSISMGRITAGLKGAWLAAFPISSIVLPGSHKGARIDHMHMLRSTLSPGSDCSAVLTTCLLASRLQPTQPQLLATLMPPHMPISNQRTCRPLPQMATPTSSSWASTHCS